MTQTNEDNEIHTEFIPTRQTLLSRLKNLEDDASWRTFFDTYWKLIYGVAIKSGLNAAEAQDAVQETIISVVRNIGTFKYDPARSSFKTWLLQVTRSRISNQFRKKQRHPDMRAEPLDQTETLARAELHQAPDELDELWNQEWEKNLMDAAIRRIKRQVDPEHYQIFDCCMFKEWPPGKVAKSFNVSVPRVYLIKHRVSKLIRHEIALLQKQPW